MSSLSYLRWVFNIIHKCSHKRDFFKILLLVCLYNHQFDEFFVHFHNSPKILVTFAWLLSPTGLAQETARVETNIILITKTLLLDISQWRVLIIQIRDQSGCTGPARTNDIGENATKSLGHYTIVFTEWFHKHI